jgi:hypothetical protein
VVREAQGHDELASCTDWQDELAWAWGCVVGEEASREHPVSGAEIVPTPLILVDLVQRGVRD